MNFDEKTEIEEMNLIHTINAIEIAAEINTGLLISHKLEGFEKLYREMYPLFYRENLNCLLNPVENVYEEYEDEFNDDSDELKDDEKRVIEILMKKPEDITESDKRELMSLFATFINLFGRTC